MSYCKKSSNRPSQYPTWHCHNPYATTMTHPTSWFNTIWPHHIAIMLLIMLSLQMKWISCSLLYFGYWLDFSCMNPGSWVRSLSHGTVQSFILLTNPHKWVFPWPWCWGHRIGHKYIQYILAKIYTVDFLNVTSQPGFALILMTVLWPLQYLGLK